MLAEERVHDTLARDAHTALARRAEKYAANLLTRRDQCLALLACTAIYPAEDGVERAVICIDRAVAAARAIAFAAERFFL